MPVRGGGAVGREGHEKGDEGFPGDVGRVEVRDELDGLAGASLRWVI